SEPIFARHENEPFRDQCSPYRFARHENELSGTMFAKPLCTRRKRTYPRTMFAKPLCTTRKRTYPSTMFATRWLEILIAIVNGLERFALFVSGKKALGFEYVCFLFVPPIKYRNCIFYSGHFMQGIAALKKKVNSETPRTPIPMTQELFGLTMEAESRLPHKVALLLMWASAARVGDILQLASERRPSGFSYNHVQQRQGGEVTGSIHSSNNTASCDQLTATQAVMGPAKKEGRYRW
ncbi:Hypothetical protein, putative, partial [Bodo saltans]